jgi:hypothetical protein
MFFSYLYRFILFHPFLGFVCSASPLNGRGAERQFHIYAFGENISGLQVFYADGNSPL